MEQLLKMTEAGDTFAAIGSLESHGNPVEVGNRYSQLVKDLYRGRKDVPLMSLFGRAGIQYCLTAAGRLERTDPNRAAELKGIAKMIAYNLGANTWPGWGEEGVLLTATDLKIGLDAAKLNLRLGTELKRDDTVMGNAHWLVGAQLLAAGEAGPAIASFHSSAKHFRAAGKEDYALMAEGYAALTQMAGKDLQEEGEKQFAEIIVSLKQCGSDDAEFFAAQLDTARSVFVK